MLQCWNVLLPDSIPRDAYACFISGVCGTLLVHRLSMIVGLVGRYAGSGVL
jgi:hypothetical protein